MSGSFNFYKQASTQDELAAGFVSELASFEPASSPDQIESPITTAEVVGLVIKCAEELEAVQFDTAPADVALEFLETELL